MEQMLTTEDDFSWKELGRRIRDRRLELGLQQDQLAGATELSEAGLYRIERGATNPQLGSLQRIAAALGSSVRELLCGAAKPTSEAQTTLSRAARLLASNDPVVLQILDNALDSAEAILHRPPVRVSFRQGSIREEEEALIEQAQKSSQKSLTSKFTTLPSKQQRRKESPGSGFVSGARLSPDEAAAQFVDYVLHAARRVPAQTGSTASASKPSRSHKPAQHTSGDPL